MARIGFTTTLTTNAEALQALYNYGRLNQELLLHESAFFFPLHSLGDSERAQYERVAPVRQFANTDELSISVSASGVDILYVLKEGGNDGVVAGSIPTVVHCLRTGHQPHGSAYAVVSPFVGCVTRTPIVPLAVLPRLVCNDMRNALQIPRDAFVFGVFGTDSDLDLPGIKEALSQFADRSPERYLLFCGVREFSKNKNLIFLPMNFEQELRSALINTCDVLLQTRSLGETFGIECAEFSLHNRPVIAFRDGQFQAHIEGLGSAAFYYSNLSEMTKWLSDFKPQPEVQWLGYQQSRDTVRCMELFEQTFIHPFGKVRGVDCSLIEVAGVSVSVPEMGRDSVVRHANSPTGQALVNFLNIALEAGDTYLEVGAGCGVTLMSAAKRIGPDGLLIGFEPQSALFLALKRSVLNSKANGSHLVHAAVGDKAGFTRLSEISGGDSQEVFVMGEGGAGEGVDLVRIDDYQWSRPINYLQIDGRGAESFILEGARQTILRDRPILSVLVNKDRLARYGASTIRLLEVIREHHYELIAGSEELVFGVPRERFVEFLGLHPSYFIDRPGDTLIPKMFLVPSVEPSVSEPVAPRSSSAAVVIPPVLQNVISAPPSIVIVAKEVLDGIELGQYARFLDDFAKQWFFLEAGKEHYRLLAHLSGLFPGRVILDIGTNRGASAVALAHDPRTQVISYDIVDNKSIRIERPNIEFRLKNVLEDHHQIMSAPLLFLDTFHDGQFEAEFYQYLLEHGYRGLLLLDDIHLNPEMEAFWGQIKLPKVDLSAVGHWSGTGLVYM